MSAHDDYCLAQVRQGDRDRYLALLFSPANVRDGLAAVAAFNLELARASSEISESMLGLVRLQWWREAVEEIRAGGATRRHMVVDALSAATRAYRLSVDRMLAMVAGREEELESDGAPTQAAFESRADATAANLIRLSLEVAGLNPAEPALAAASTEIGRAYATIGCARSVLLDARRRRVRLPAEALAQASVDLDTLFDLRPQPALQACLGALAKQAQTDLDAARRRPIPRGARPLTLTAKLAALHLERLRRAAYDPFDPRVIAAPPFDVWRLLGTAITGRF
ncbi:MAG TPA: squalene/phytoene synthase family protein [Dongiaceae bacterium]|nr:squalene/phytoene synthase family protein [Dongiaceae bacterium]